MICILMKYLILPLILSHAFVASYIRAGKSVQPRVSIRQGALQGITMKTIHNRNIAAFRGIRYAQPPIGNLRFANPIAATGWKGTRNASIEGNPCLQLADGGISGKTPSTTPWIGDEDCLYLNVYTPMVSKDSCPSLFPVMVFIHGGYFVSLSSVSTKFGPEYILDENVVLVTLNYRQGPFGLLSTGDEVASGNWALKDQILALKWVQDNIKFFGGNPNQVTLFGQSAGAASIHLLSSMDTTIGLFHRCITQSGSALAPWAYQPRATHRKQAFKLGRSVGCSNKTSDSLIECLRTVNGPDIIATYVQPSLETYSDVWSPTDEPDIEGAVLKDSPANLLATGQSRDLPWISGVNRDEGLLLTAALYEDEKRLGHFLENLDSLLPPLVGFEISSDEGAAQFEAMKLFYFNNDLTANKSSLLANLTMAIGDGSFVYPAWNSLQQKLAVSAKPQYFYEFSYEGSFSFSYVSAGLTKVYGTSHCDDLIYLFESPDFYLSSPKTMRRKDYEMINVMVKFWTSFAIDGKPSNAFLDNTVAWKPYSLADNYLQIGCGSDLIVGEKYSFLKERMQFWTNLYNITETC